MSGSTSPVASLTEGVQRHQLPNGLTVLVKEDPSSPAVAVVTWVKTGYFHEPDELAGISHVVEHMFFNGTPTRPGPEDISRETKGFGGSLNAGTIYDHTSYYVVLPSDRWREGLAVQADAFQNPLFDQKVLDKEMQAILQEARRKLDNPSAFGMEKLFELAFDRHRMRRWRIGTEDVLESMTRDDLVKWYQDHYRPQNTVLSVVGDVDAAEVFAEIERLYAGQPKGHLRQRGGPAEPRQEAFRYSRIKGDIQRHYLFVGYHVPGEGHEDLPAIEVLSTILGSGRSSRLVSQLQENLGVVNQISASSFQYEDVGLLTVNAVCSVEDLDRASRQIFAEVERMKLFGPTEEEIRRAKVILETGEATSQEEVLGQASILAHYEALGDYRRYDEELADLRAVTVEDVQRVAREYLDLENASLLEYVPPNVFDGRAPEDMAEHMRGAVLAEVRQMQRPVAAEAAPSVLPRMELEQWAQRFDEPDRVGEGRREFDLPGGATLVVEERHAVPTAHLGVYFRGGRIAEFENIAGLTRMMQRLMVKETYNRSAEQLAEEIESLGTSIGRVSTDDTFGFTVGGLARNLPFAFDVLFDVVANPRFTSTQQAREIEAHLSAIQGVQDQSGSYALQLLRRALYPEHAYGLPDLGTEVAISNLALGRIEEHHVDVVRPETMVISVAGDVDADAVHEFLLRYLGDWKVGGFERPSTAVEFYQPDRFDPITPLLSERRLEVQRDRAQTAMVLGWRTAPVGDPDSEALDALQAITGGLGGTFFEEIRTKRGLAYTVATLDVGRALSGWFGTFVACSPDSAETVENLVLDLHQRLTEEAPSQADLERARNYLAGSWKVGLQTNRARAGTLASYELLGLPLERIDDYPERIQAVTREDLLRVAQTYFQGQPYAVGEVAGTPGAGASPR